MKTTLALILSTLVSTAYSQCKVAMDEVDAFTGKRTVALKGDYLGTLVQVAARIDSSYYLYLSTHQDVGCSQTGQSQVWFKLDDGTIIQLPHVGSLNCKGSFTIKLDDYIAELKTHNVTTIRLIGSRSEERRVGQERPH